MAAICKRDAASEGLGLPEGDKFYLLRCRCLSENFSNYRSINFLCALLVTATGRESERESMRIIARGGCSDWAEVAAN